MIIDVHEVNHVNCKKLFILSVYRPPGPLNDEFILNLDSALSSIPTNAEFVLLGDFNVNFQDGRFSTQLNSKQKLVRLANIYHLEQLIVEPTRVAESSSTLIDLLFVKNSHKIVDSGVIHLPISDHSIIFCVIKGGVKKAPSRIVEFRSYKRYCKDTFVNELGEVNWHFIDEIPDLDSAISAWSTLFTDVTDCHAPIKKQ